MTVTMPPTILPIFVRGQHAFLILGERGFITKPEGPLKTFSTIDDAKRAGGREFSEFSAWPFHEADLELARHWAGATIKSTSLDTLSKLANVHGVYTNILITYGEAEPVPEDIASECVRSHAAFAVLKKLTELSMREVLLDFMKDVPPEKLSSNWKELRELKNEWSPEELEQLSSELAIEVEFIEKKLGQADI